LIRRAGPADLDAFFEVMAAGFGGEYRRPNMHTFVAALPDGHMIVAERDGRVVGTAASIGFGPTAWIGAVAVLPEARGERLGRALTEAAITALGPRESVLLLASAAGRPTYERMGFVAEGSYRTFSGPEGARPFPSESVRPALPADHAAIRALDVEATGEDRGPVVAPALDDALVAEGGAAPRPPFFSRPVLARTPEAGRALLAAVAEPGVRLAAPAANPAAVEAIVALGAPEREAVERMRLGRPVAWRPELVWNVFGLFFG
jgi:predicted N-acetyltransferase YhbS